jgi:hypothetical protein
MSSMFVPVRHKRKSILEAEETWLVNLCAARAIRPAGGKGLVADIFAKFPNADLYKHRNAMGVGSDVDKPGMIRVSDDPTSEERFVVHLLMQIRHKKPDPNVSERLVQTKLPHKPNPNSDAAAAAAGALDEENAMSEFSSGNEMIKETSEDRFKWFMECIERIKKQFKWTDKDTTFAFPSRLSPDDPPLWEDSYWTRYEDTLKAFNEWIQSKLEDYSCARVVTYLDPTWTQSRSSKTIKLSKTQQTLSFGGAR